MSQVTNTLLYYAAPLKTLGNLNDQTAAAAVTAAFTHVVLGTEVGTDVADLQVIMDAARDINPDIRFFGYTSLGDAPDVPTWQAQVDAWTAHFAPTGKYPLCGLFIDRFDLTFAGATRANQNAAVAYLHGLGLAAFVNAQSLPGAFGPDPTSNLAPAVGQDRTLGDYFLLEDVVQDHVNSQTKETPEHLRGRLEYAASVQRTFNARAAAVLGAGAGVTLVPWQLWRSTIALLSSYGIAVYGIGDADYGASGHTYWLINQASVGPPPWPVWCSGGAAGRAWAGPWTP